MSTLESLVRESSHALVVGVGGGGDVVGALACARFLEFLGLGFHLGGLPWERYVYDPRPGPRPLADIEHVRVLHPHAWLVNGATRTRDGVRFAESEMATFHGREVLHVDILAGAKGAAEGLDAAARALGADLLVGLDVGGDSLAAGGEPGLRSPLADAVMLAAFAELEGRGQRALWAVFGYGSDGELTPAEIESALALVARKGGLLGAWGLTQKVADELERVIERVPTEASAVPLECARGATGVRRIRNDERRVVLTPLATLTFFLSPRAVVEAVSRPAKAVAGSTSLEEANDALHALGIYTELDFERDKAAGKERGGK